MIEVEVRNFQSIECASIQIDGFTAFVGKSNIGKSAFVRAVRAALTGAPITSSIRHSPSCPRRLKKAKSCACFASVKIKTEGFNLLWEKGDAINRYVFNGTVYDKVAQGTPDFLQDRFAPVKIGDGKELLQVSDQFSPIFLLDQTGTVVADVLSDVARLDRINIAMRNAERDRKEAIATRKVREKDILVLEADLASYEGLDEAVTQAGEVEHTYSVIERAQGAITQLGCYQKALENLTSEAQGLEDACRPDVPAAGALLEKLAISEKLRRLYQQLSERANAVRALLGVEALGIDPIHPAQTSAQIFEKLRVWTAAMFDFQRWFDHRKVVDGAEVPSLGSLSDDAHRLIVITQMADRLAATAKAAASLEAEMKKAVQEEAEVLQEFGAIGVCPTCTQAVHPTPH